MLEGLNGSFLPFGFWGSGDQGFPSLELFQIAAAGKGWGIAPEALCSGASLPKTPHLLQIPGPDRPLSVHGNGKCFKLLELL